MQKYRGSRLIRAGFIGVVLIVLIIAVGLQPERLYQWATSLRYQALFTEAGGLAVGNDVTVSGIKVGSVSSIELENGDALVSFTIDGRYALGSDSTAHIRTGTLLGERVLALESKGTGTLDRREVIPITRTSSPYSLTDAVSGSSQHRRDGRGHSTSPSTRWRRRSIRSPAARADVRRIVAAVAVTNNRNESLAELLRTAGDVTGIFAERSQQVNALILNANDLLGVVNERRHAISRLLANTATVSRELTAVVGDNESSCPRFCSTSTRSPRCWRRTATTSPRCCPVRRNTI